MIVFLLALHSYLFNTFILTAFYFVKHMDYPPLYVTDIKLFFYSTFVSCYVWREFV